MAKLFAKFHKEKTIDPRSHQFTDTILKLLTEHGITDKRVLNECSLKLFKRTIGFYRLVSTNLEPSDDDIKTFEVDMCEILGKYGISDPAEQEDIFTQYFDTITELGGQGVEE